MTSALPPELYWLALTTTMTGLFWVPYILQRILEHGFWQALWDPQGITRTDAAWADRMRRAHLNAVENLAIFAPLVLALTVTHSGTATTAGASGIYFAARVTHFLVYTMAIPVLRVVVFLVGFGAQMVLALTLLGAI